MRTQLKICTDADYLQAHLTLIDGEPRVRKTTWQDMKERVTSVLKRWILAANSSLANRALFSMRA
ncbi:MAG: hypothetical protein M3N22_03260 [Acidobacteriota bacterium]|nr:hypothetical protein [Acidobacteriota bacterium]